MKHLFFRRVPDLPFVERLLAAYGVGGLNAPAVFTKDDLRARGTPEQVKPLVEELRGFYIPCKYRVYVAPLTDAEMPCEVRVKKCITLLRQILRLHSVYVLSNQVMKFGEKKVHYTIMWPDRPHHMLKSESDVTVSFD